MSCTRRRVMVLRLSFSCLSQANPPFVEEVMERMVDHIHHLLRRATGPMSFAVIVPGWDDDGCVSYQNMKNSRFARPHPGEPLPGTAAR